MYFYGIELQSSFIKIVKKKKEASDPVLFLYHK